LTVSDADNDTVECDLAAVNPKSGAFGVWRASTGEYVKKNLSNTDSPKYRFTNENTDT